jgi:hemoglobin-like flavoprotein
MNEYLTAEHIALLKRTFRQLDTVRVASQFYRKLFALYPEVKSMFPSDTSDLGIKLMSVFELAVFSFEEKTQNQFGLQDAVIAPLRELGRKHESKGVLREHYKIANRLLLETMKNESPDVFSSKVEQSWALALQHLTFAMLDSNVNPKNISDESGISLRETFSYLRQKIKKPRIL